MLTNTSIPTRAITAEIDSKQLEQIKAYIQGAVYCFCKNCPAENGGSKPFHARDLFGGENYFWQSTPLFALYEWHEKKGEHDPVKMAAKDMGHLLKAVIEDDPRREYALIKNYTNQYRWTGKDSASE